jgi:hypothetical protein
MPTAEINVPRNANVRMEPKLRKKLSYGETAGFLLVRGSKDRQTYLLQLVAGVQDDGWKEEVEEERVLESLSLGQKPRETTTGTRSATWRPGFPSFLSAVHLRIATRSPNTKKKRVSSSKEMGKTPRRQHRSVEVIDIRGDV